MRARRASNGRRNENNTTRLRVIGDIGDIEMKYVRHFICVSGEELHILIFDGMAASGARHAEMSVSHVANNVFADI